jgi:hypothetical protein
MPRPRVVDRAAAVAAQHVESLIDGTAVDLGDRALRLLDDDPAVQCALHGPLLEQTDRGHVRQSLHHMHIGGLHLTKVSPEQVQGADDLQRSLSGRACTDRNPTATARGGLAQPVST